MNGDKRRQLGELLSRGFSELSRGNIAQAGECCRQVLAIQPDLVQGHFLVGLVGLEAKDRKTAFSAFQSVVKLDREHAAAWAHLAKLYMSEGQINLADKALDEMRRIGSEDPLVLDLAGTTLSLMGEHGLAQNFFKRATELSGQHPPFTQNLANNLVYFGETSQSDTLFRQIIDQQPNSPQAHWSLAGSSRATDSSHIEQMRELTELPRQHPRALAFYYYAMGKEYEDLQQWPQAFECFSQGAAAKRQTVQYDEQAEADMFSCLQTIYTEEWFAQAKAGSPDASPIFVLGQPRTGTTLIERIISSHSQVHSAGELQQFGLALRRLSDHRDPRRFSAGLFEACQALDWQAVGAMYLQTSRKMRSDAPRFVDKLPQNYLMIPMILKALPNARIVHLVRNPMDACFASFKQLFADAYLHSYDQEEMARHHCRYLTLMNVWRERFPGRIHDVHYEQITADLEPNARALIDYLELPWEDSCLHFHEQSTAVSTASAVQVREPAHTRSIGRWRRYEEQLQPMSQALHHRGISF